MVLHVEVIAASALAHERVAQARRRLAPVPMASGGVNPNGMGDLDGGHALWAHRRQLHGGRGRVRSLTASRVTGRRRGEGGGGRGRRKQALRPVSARGAHLSTARRQQEGDVDQLAVVRVSAGARNDCQRDVARVPQQLEEPLRTEPLPLLLQRVDVVELEGGESKDIGSTLRPASKELAGPPFKNL